MANLGVEGTAEKSIDYSVFTSEGERLHFERLKSFFGDSLAQDFYRTYLSSPVGQRNLCVAAQRVLVRKEEKDSANVAAFLRTRFSSALEDDFQIVFDR